MGAAKINFEWEDSLPVGAGSREPADLTPSCSDVRAGGRSLRSKRRGQWKTRCSLEVVVCDLPFWHHAHVQTELAMDKRLYSQYAKRHIEAIQVAQPRREVSELLLSKTHVIQFVSKVHLYSALALELQRLRLKGSRR